MNWPFLNGIQAWQLHFDCTKTATSKGGSIDTKTWRKKVGQLWGWRFCMQKNTGFQREPIYNIHSIRNWVNFLSLLEMSLLRIEGLSLMRLSFSVRNGDSCSSFFLTAKKTTAEKTSENWMPWQHDSIACDFRLWEALEQRVDLFLGGFPRNDRQLHMTLPRTFLRMFCYKSRSVWRNAENLLTVHRFVHLCAFFCMFSTFLDPTDPFSI